MTLCCLTNNVCDSETVGLSTCIASSSLCTCDNYDSFAVILLLLTSSTSITSKWDGSLEQKHLVRQSEIAQGLGQRENVNGSSTTSPPLPPAKKHVQHA